MSNFRITILYIFLIFVVTGCIKCYTLFRSQIEETQCLEIRRVTGVVNEDGPSGSVTLNVDIEWCDSYGQNNCCQKKIKDDSFKILAKVGGQNLSFTNEIESTYEFSSRSAKAFEQNDKAEIFVAYKVDSLGIELNRSNSFILYRDKDCNYSVH